uniref:Tetraspanin n=1 Tax=Geotrypetes seraphini TaxID=260995 RepID=A0A6P8NV38_GEOSA|nr:leukocyte surface antigen CD53 isoform X3 [Geotrypetes seraphini]XP_033774854.1 leukocyte surface antigen CD53 isoform X3 [Geotrypetes seraphini]
MAKKCLRIMKYTLFFFNLLFWMCGCTILGFGIYFMINNHFTELFPNIPSLSLSNVLIVIGSIVMVVSFLGCMGAIKENKCLLMSFFSLLLFILLTEVALAVLLFVYEEKLDALIEQQLNSSLQEHIGKNASDTSIWGRIQEKLKCCGVKKVEDWKQSVPKSCEETPGHYFKEGCYSKVKAWFESNFIHVGITTIIISIIQVLGMSFSLTLYCQIAKMADN